MSTQKLEFSGQYVHQHTHFILKTVQFQVHYASVDYIDPEGDDSGVFLEYTEQEQPKTAGVLLLGTGGNAPAHTTTYFETSCEIEDSRQIHPFAFRTHTHSLGKKILKLFNLS